MHAATISATTFIALCYAEHKLFSSSLLPLACLRNIGFFIEVLLALALSYQAIQAFPTHVLTDFVGAQDKHSLCLDMICIF